MSAKGARDERNCGSPSGSRRQARTGAHVPTHEKGKDSCTTHTNTTLSGTSSQLFSLLRSSSLFIYCLILPSCFFSARLTSYHPFSPLLSRLTLSTSSSSFISPLLSSYMFPMRCLASSLCLTALCASVCVCLSCFFFPWPLCPVSVTSSFLPCPLLPSLALTCPDLS